LNEGRGGSKDLNEGRGGSKDHANRREEFIFSVAIAA